MLEEGDKKKRMSIDELEKLLDSTENNDPSDQGVLILPNGEIRSLDGEELPEGVKPITFREDLGGEYAKQQTATDYPCRL